MLRIFQNTGTLLLLMLLVTLPGCQDRQIGARVHDYDQALIRAYREQNADLIKPFATEDEWRKVFALIDLKKASRLILESELLEFKVLNTQQVNEDHYKVTTEELWTYYDRPLDPGKDPGTRFKVRMKLEFELVKEDGIYKVNKGKALSSQYIEPAGFVLHQNTHGRPTTDTDTTNSASSARSVTETSENSPLSRTPAANSLKQEK